MTDRPWTNTEADVLRRLWIEGITTAAIGRSLSRSGNAVIGKARRLHLQPRPSPIRPSDPSSPWHAEYARKKERRIPRSAPLPSLSSLEPCVMPVSLQNDVTPCYTETQQYDSPDNSLQDDGHHVMAMETQQSEDPVESVVKAPSPVSLPSSISCRWPLWSNTARPDQRFCDNARDPGHSYCIQHCATAYRSWTPTPVSEFRRYG